MAASHLASFLVPFLMVLLLRLALLPVLPPPQPIIHDEFSYLLAADTFASFRLTNPPHPLWQHFETLHELMQPTYMSKYPPAQGLVLAFGKILFGTPWAGVMLSMAFFCGLLPWAFRAWMPASWALIGGMLATLKIGVLSYWTESYWGGGVAALGGTLALGAVVRLGRRPTATLAAIFVLGIGILANSRPDSAAVLLVIYGPWLLWRWFGAGRRKTTWPSYPARVLPGACLAALPILLFMGYYNFRVTGSPLTLPYQVYEKQYSVWTPFIWQQHPSPTPAYRHEFLRRFWVGMDGDNKVREHLEYVRRHFQDFRVQVQYYFGFAFYPAVLLLIPALGIGRKIRTIFGLFLACAVWDLAFTEVFPHYTAGIAALAYLAATAVLRAGWRLAWKDWPIGKWAVLTLVAGYILSTVLLWPKPESRSFYPQFDVVREQHDILATLDSQPGRQLVFIHTGPPSSPNDIWTFNRADIDDSQIIWVDAMTPSQDQQVLDYYAAQKRNVWMLDYGEYVTLTPYGHPNTKPIFQRKNRL